MTIKTASVWPVNELGEIVVQAGTGTTTVTGFVSQDQIPTDPATNKVVMKLPDLDAIVLAEPLTGYVSGAGTVAATDTLLQAFNKLDGNTVVQSARTTTGTTAPVANGILTDFVFAHNHSTTPTHVSVTPKNAGSSSAFFVTWDATNITVSYLVAPLTAALSFSFSAQH